MHIGMLFANALGFATPQGAAEMGRAADAAGIESVWTVEHVVYPDGYESKYPYDPSGKMAMAADTPLPDPLIWLTWVAAHTERLRLATGILILPQRNPLVLAKQLATLDEASEGRMELGVGVGWLREEFEALGIPFEGRGRRTDEYIEVMRTLWADDHAEYSGEFTNFSGVSVNPKPVNGRVPIHIGGHSPAAARRAGRLGDGFFPGEGDIDELLRIMRESALEADRDPAEIEVTYTHPGLWGADPLAAVEEMAAKGVHRMGMPGFIFAMAPDPAEAIAEFGEKVARPASEI
ncbi:MAG: LLM class F420-dependent oxidoreductase [Microthrixaceae bacterium]|nr:LLM class F420-dependent oxidoreductase [Microthrixaceae bacterium]MCB1011799.1 LLM class F420-dependent oxidoreductase [Microthrixaceae bacterium]